MGKELKVATVFPLGPAASEFQLAVSITMRMEWFTCRVQYANDLDPLAYSNSSFPEPTRPPVYTFSANLPLAHQLAAVHRLLKAPHQVDHFTFFDMLWTWDEVGRLSDAPNEPRETYQRQVPRSIFRIVPLVCLLFGRFGKRFVCPTLRQTLSAS